MSRTVSVNHSKDRKAYIITGPTSGIGRATALELAKHGTVVLVGRDPRKLEELQKILKQMFEIAKASQREGGRPLVFMDGTWSRCPAADWVPAMMEGLWLRATG